MLLSVSMLNMFMLLLFVFILLSKYSQVDKACSIVLFCSNSNTCLLIINNTITTSHNDIMPELSQ